MSVNLGPTGLIGAGQVLQVVRAMSSTQASRNSMTYGEVSTDYRIGITPKLSTSKLKFIFNIFHLHLGKSYSGNPFPWRCSNWIHEEGS